MAKRRKSIDDLSDITREEAIEALKMIAVPPYSPENESLDLLRAEKLRTTALLMAIQYVEKTICNDVDMYREIRATGRELVPATTPHVIRSAMQFEQFLLGRYSEALQKPEMPTEEGKPPIQGPESTEGASQ